MGHEKRTDDVLNINGDLNKIILDANVVTKIYSPSDSNGKYGYVNFNVLNINGVASEIQIYVSRETDPLEVSDIDLIEFNIGLKANGGVYIRNNFLIGKDETIYIKSNSSDVVVRLDGSVFRK